VTATHPATPAFQPGGRPLVAELYVGRTKMPWLSRQAWRWDVEWHRIGDRESWTRWHVAGDFGYARTRWGAWRAVRRAYTRRTARFDGRHDQVQPEPDFPRGESETVQQGWEPPAWARKDQIISDAPPWSRRRP
jgi:hypothetical protein